MQHVHILGIGGTFMSGLAILAREAGYKVTGSDANCYPPISDLLAAKGITWQEGYDDASLALEADHVLIGNAIKRGMPVLEAVMNAGKNYSSGPQWLAEHVLKNYRVLAVAGTHGKTTTTSMLAFILEQAGLKPGFLIGGVAPNFSTNARLGEGEFFVIEADEYDSAFFDKRPKFIHYQPEIAILNNLEFDHADIYNDLSAIQRQFHYYLKTIPNKGVVIKPRDDKNLNEVVQQGLYSRLEEMTFEGDACWRAELLEPSAQRFRVFYQNKEVACIDWSLIGQFNAENALAALAAASHAGVSPEQAAAALALFQPVKRRLEVKFQQQGVTVYDDFAHHPTAIARTIHALKHSGRHKRIFVVLEFASYTMRTGVHETTMGKALAEADKAFILKPADFTLKTDNWTCAYQVEPSVPDIVKQVKTQVESNDAILVMSNRGFGNIYQQLAEAISL